MKLLLSFVFCLVFISSCDSQKAPVTTIKGQIKNEKAGTKIYLEELTYSSRNALDTAELDAQGDFSIKENLKTPGLYQLRIGEQKAIYLVLDGKPGTVVLNADTASIRNFGYSIHGSPASEQLRKFIVETKRKGEAFGIALSEYNRMASDSSSDSVRKVYAAKVMSADSLLRNYVSSYVDTVKNPVIAVFAITNLDFDHDRKSYDQLTERVRTTNADIPIVKSYLAMVDERKQANAQQGYGPKFEEGTVAPDIIMSDLSGNQQKLSSLRGNYVLLDFWASWCGPCRAENPNVVQAYQKYHSKGFMIFSVSLDTDKEKWIKAISKDHLDWPNHVSELKGWQSQICQSYGIMSIPASYLLDREGKIIGVNLRGAELDSRLAGLFQ